MMRQVQRGFTLVELLLAITLMAILLALAYGGLRASTKASETGQEQLEDTLNLRVTHQFLRRQLNQMQPLTFDITGNTAQDRVVFEGEQRFIRFVSPMPGYLGMGGPQVQTVSITPGPEGLDMWFNHELLQTYDPNVGETSRPVLLMEGLKDAGFEFLARDEDGQILGWTGSWVRPDLVPVAVRLVVETADESKVVWPVLSAGVRVDELASTATGAANSYSDALRNLLEPSGGTR